MKTVIITIIAVLMIIATLLAAPLLIPTKTYRTQITEALAHMTGMKVSIGEMSVRLVPYPTFTIEGLELNSPEEPFMSMPAVKVRRVIGTFSPVDVLKKRLKSDLAMEGFELNVVRGAAGVSNIDRLFMALASRAAERGTSDWDITVNSIALLSGICRTVAADGTISRIVTGATASATGLTFGTMTSGSVRLTANAFASKGNDIEASGRLFFDATTSMVHLRSVKLTVLGASGTLDASIDMAHTPAAFEVRAATPAIGPAAIAKLFPSIGTKLPAGIFWSGPAALDLYLKTAGGHAEITMQADLIQSAVTAGSIFAKPQGRELKLEFAGLESNSHLEISALILRLGKNVIQIAGTMLHDPDHQSQLSIASHNFDLVSLKPSLPWLGVFEGLTEPSVSITMRGSLDVPSNRIMVGAITAKAMRVFGFDITEARVDFDHRESTVALPAIAGSVYNGKLSGNGSITLGETDDYRLSLVANNVHLDVIDRLNGNLRGTGAMVLAMSTKGSTPEELTSNIVIEGSLVAKDVALPSIAVGQALFGTQTWNIMNAAVEGISIDGQRASAAEALTANFGDVKAAFTVSKERLEISDLRAVQPAYTLWLRGETNESGWLDATGSVWLRAKEVNSLIGPPNARSAVTNAKGDLQIPFSLKGNSTGLLMRLAADELLALLKGSMAATPTIAFVPGSVAAEETPAAKPPAETPTPPTTSKIKPAAPAVVPPAPAQKKLRKSAPAKRPSTPSTSSEDIMKVIIR